MTGLELAIFIISPILSFGIAILCSPQEIEYKNEYSSPLFSDKLGKTKGYQIYVDEPKEQQLVRKQL